jgi:formylglycine-generating enzyme required for sulfatase activity
MPRWFLSYNSADHALAERLKAGIERKDSASRVFFASTNLRAGGSWSAQLAREIAEATAFILLIGQAGIGKWQVPEYDEALDKWVKSDRKFPLIVVLLEGQTAPGLPFLRQLHWIVSPDPACEHDIARTFDAASGEDTRPGELWRYTSPYRGLEAMEEKDSDYFFGRKRETVELLSALASSTGQLPVLIGNSGVGKSSLAQAGALAALKRQAWPEDVNAPNAWPAAFHNSRQWCFLSFRPGTAPLKALVEAFLERWQFAATDPERATRQYGWMEALRNGKATLPDLIDATERRCRELEQPAPPGFFLYVDQGEELYVRAEESQRRPFSEVLVQALADRRLHAMMSMRSDLLGALQSDKPLFRARQQIDVPPLGEEELREVVARPAQMLAARFETEGLIDIISRHAADDGARDVGALPLLSYTLDDMWTQMVRRGDGVLRLHLQSFELGGVLVHRADQFLAAHPASEAALRRVLTLRLATVREGSEPTRRRAARSEFANEEWRLVSELANHPNRLVVVATSEAGETYAEVAHEAIFRRWGKLHEWIAAEREFLAWRNGLEAACRAWQTIPDHSKSDALLMGLALAQAQSWLAKRPDDIPEIEREFIVQSRRLAHRRKLLAGSLIGVLALGVVAGLAAWVEHDNLAAYWRYYTVIRPYMVSQFWPHVLNTAAEQALKPGDSFKECATDCPEMVVVPAGSFTMGSAPTEKGRFANEGPQHQVTIAKAFAVSKYELTFVDWDACAAHGDCPRADDFGGWGRGLQPAINVSWEDAEHYVAWLSKMTGKTYRLLSEAEYEYATRAGKQTAYPWGDDITLDGAAMANCRVCGDQWAGKRTAPVGSFPPNKFGLYDMVGNVWEWITDCARTPFDHNGAPTDGSAWTTGGDCSRRVVRGGAWDNSDENGDVRSAIRRWLQISARFNNLGLRVARSLGP